MAKYIMVDVYDREMVVHQYDSLADAKNDLREMYEEALSRHNLVDGQDSYISEDCMCAWVNGSNDSYDWQIEEIDVG